MDFSTAFAPGGVTVASLVIAILLAGSRGIWYYGTTHKDVLKERDDWKEIAISATGTVKDQAGQIVKLTEIAENLSRDLSVRINPRKR